MRTEPALPPRCTLARSWGIGGGRGWISALPPTNTEMCPSPKQQCKWVSVTRPAVLLLAGMSLAVSKFCFVTGVPEPASVPVPADKGFVPDVLLLVSA